MISPVLISMFYFFLQKPDDEPAPVKVNIITV